MLVQVFPMLHLKWKSFWTLVTYVLHPLKIPDRKEIIVQVVCGQTHTHFSICHENWNMYMTVQETLCYLCDCLQLYTPSRTRHSTSDTLSLQFPCIRLFTVGSRAFSVFSPSTWNDLHLPVQQKPALDSFKSNLKTFLSPDCRPAMFSVPCWCLHPFQVSWVFAAHFELCIF